MRVRAMCANGSIFSCGLALVQAMKDALDDMRRWGLQRERTEEAGGGRRQASGSRGHRAGEGAAAGPARVGGRVLCRCQGLRVHAC